MISIDRRLFSHINWPLLGLLLLLFSVGVLNLYSAGGVRVEGGVTVQPFWQKQLVWGGLGLLCMLAFMSVSYEKFKSLCWPLYGVTVVLLLAVDIMGRTYLGAQRWLSVGGVSFQPSEVAKLCVLLVASRLLSRRADPLDWGELFTVLGIALIPVALVVVQPDLGTGMNILLLLGGLVLYRGLTLRVLRVLLIVVPALPFLAWEFLLLDYQKDRVMSFLDPSSDPRGSGWQVIQSQIAIGSGEMWGKGYLSGTQGQLRFLPEKHTDFAVAILGEEWGFVGAVVLLSLFTLFLYSIFLTARDAKDRFGSFLAAGVFFYFFCLFTINLGMVLGMMPVVGLPLPFVSYGGSSTLVNFSLVGLVCNVSMRRFVFKQHRSLHIKT
ncbi:rod shape-determining protein RodA [Megalodesulfovibrio paquesii]